MEDRPVTAYLLSMMGLCLQVVASIFIFYMVASFSTVAGGWGLHWDDMGPWMMERWMRGYPYTLHPFWSFVWIMTAVLVIGVGAYGVFLMSSTKVGRVRTGAALVLIASLIAFPTMWGFMIGSLLMFVGGVLGLAWQPRTAETAQPFSTA